MAYYKTPLEEHEYHLAIKEPYTADSINKANNELETWPDPPQKTVKDIVAFGEMPSIAKLVLLRQIKVIIQNAFERDEEIPLTNIYDILNRVDLKNYTDKKKPKELIDKIKFKIPLQEWNSFPKNDKLWDFFEKHQDFLQIIVHGTKCKRQSIMIPTHDNEIIEANKIQLNSPLNQIFYGPPGTGKTYHTIKAAIKILAPELSESSREEQKTRFNSLLSEGKIRFVTFHQSFSYEDFVEGIRPNVSSENTITYSVFSGAFKELCNDAAGIKQNSPLYTGLELDGYTVEKISSEMLLLQKPRAGSKLPLPFLIINELVALVQNGDISLVDIFSKSVFQRLEQLNITSTMEKYFVNGYPQPLGNTVKFIIENTNTLKNNSEPYVLIIDEINRGNISGIFGELITLIEPSKRLGAEEALKVTLPYSRESFGVPNNLYIIGTMNTADRSLTGLDIALRRRFTFVEMPPNYSLLEDKQIENTDVYLSQILQAMNARIEVLLGRDYCLGHAPFMPLGNTVTVAELETIFKNTIIPLLQEYFFEDWRKIHLVLNDHKKDVTYRFIIQKTIPTDIFDEEELAKFSRELWEINDEAFEYIESYIGISNPT